MYEQLKEQFCSVFGEKPTLLFSAPGRTELCGNHTDHQCGMVLAASVNVDDRQLLKALIHKSPVPIQGVNELPRGMGAYYDNEQKIIFVRRGMEAHDSFRSLSKELAHAELALSSPEYSRESAGFAAYSVSYVVCKRYGVDVSAYDFSALPDSIRDAGPQTVRAALNEISETAKDITGRMNRALEQVKAPRAKEQER